MQTRQLALLYSLAGGLNQQKSTDELFNIAMDWLQRLFGFDVGVLRLLDGNSLKLMTSKGIESDMLGKIEVVMRGKSISGLAAASGKVIVVDDISTATDSYADLAKNLGLECVISIPLTSGNRFVGTLSVGSRIKKTLCDEYVTMLDAVGKLLGIAIERSEEFATEMKKVKELAHQADKLGALGRLAAGIAHNVNNPLTYVMNYLYVLKGTVNSKDANPLINKIEEGISRAKDVLQGLMDLSNPAQGPVEIIDMRAVTLNTILLLTPEAKEKGISINTEFGGATKIKASKKGLSEVLFNFLTNAIDAEATDITIRSYETDEDIAMLVTDNGTGIKKKHLPKVFEPYFTTKPKGTGLGLYISYHIVKSFDGDIWCSSKEGSGTQFIVTFQKGF